MSRATLREKVLLTLFVLPFVLGGGYLYYDVKYVKYPDPWAIPPDEIGRAMGLAVLGVMGFILALAGVKVLLDAWFLGGGEG